MPNRTRMTLADLHEFLVSAKFIWAIKSVIIRLIRIPFFNRLKSYKLTRTNSASEWL